jgi:putative membrane protein
MSRSLQTFLAAAIAAATLAEAPMALAASEKAFIKTAMEGDNSEIQMGKIAEQKGSSPEIRDFGRMLDMDHSAHKAKAASLATSLGVHETDDVPLMAKLEAHKLDGLSGPKFDREFAKYMVKDHKKDISEYGKQAKGHGPTADLARDTLPTLNKHLETAERLAQG